MSYDAHKGAFPILDTLAAVANTTLLTKTIEPWLREVGLPAIYPAQTFEKRKLQLQWGGMFEVDAVSDALAACITTAGLGHDNKLKVGPLNKMVKDAAFLLALVGTRRPVIVFTDAAFHAAICAEVRKGRFPPGVDLMLVKLPAELELAVLAKRREASDEVRPRYT